MIYEVTHTTRYTYEAAVAQCLNEVRLTPRALPTQCLRDHEIQVEPKPASYHRRKDYFGNEVTMFAVLEKHERLETIGRSVVEVMPHRAVTAVSGSWEHARDLLASAANGLLLEAFEYRFDSPFVAARPELADYARPTFTPGRPLMDALQELSHRIHAEFRYDPESTFIETPLTSILHDRRGVCQDFAHIMIGALRSLRLAARYVSGYLRSGAGFQGAQASHAWVAAFVPELGWQQFDPTNDVTPSDGHITLGWGRDYGDVTPVKGITLGGGGQKVDIEVLVQPHEPSAAS
jgi:transglutaminase-like putative cysteine protease